MGHARTEEGPARRLPLSGEKFAMAGAVECPARSPLEYAEVDFGLGGEPRVEIGDDFEIARERAFDRVGIAAPRKRLDHQRIEPRVHRLLDPVMAKKTLEQRIEIGVAADAFDIMGLRHPFDLQHRQRHRQGIVTQHHARDFRRWTDQRASVAEPSLKGGVKALEQLDIILENDRNNEEVFYLKGEILNTQGEIEKAFY